MTSTLRLGLLVLFALVGCGGGGGSQRDADGSPEADLTPGDADFIEDIQEAEDAPGEDPAGDPDAADVEDLDSPEDGRDVPNPQPGDDYYGNPYHWVTLWNTNLSGEEIRYDNRIWLRDGQVTGIRKYIIYSSDGGYGLGDGGILRLELQTDDGTPAHRPSGIVLAQADVVVEAESAVSRLWSFDVPATVTERWYHVVVRNVSADPAANYSGMDDVAVSYMNEALHDGLRRPPFMDDLSLTVSRSEDAGATWIDRTTFIACIQVEYASGDPSGLGAMETGSTGSGSGEEGGFRSVDGARQVREVFTPSRSFAAGALFVFVYHEAGSAPLTMTLRDLTAGTVAAAVEISADEMPIGGRGIQPLGEGRMIDAMWQWAYLPSTVTLETGNAYALELSTADGSLYQVPAVRDGHDYYSPLLGYFDGYAEHATAEEPSEWVAWGSWGSVDDNMDIGFFFTAAD